MSSPITLEVCIASPTDAKTAIRAGADRLELNTALELGGLTPSLPLVHAVRQIIEDTNPNVTLITMIRPRAAGFSYTNEEKQLILHQAQHLINANVDGFAFGARTPQQQIDIPFITQLLQITQQKQTVFHRAFDLIPDQQQALQTLIDLGLTRILTSGAQPTAPQGTQQLKSLIQTAQNKIEILPAAGINSDNVEELINSTNANQIHGSFSTTTLDPAQPIANDQYPTTCPQKVSAVRTILNQISNNQNQ